MSRIKTVDELEKILYDFTHVLSSLKAMSDPKDPFHPAVRALPPAAWAEIHKLQEQAIIAIAGHLSDIHEGPESLAE